MATVHDTKNSPVQIVETGVKDASAGGFHSLFLKEDGSVWAMGDNSGTTWRRSGIVNVLNANSVFRC